MDELTVVHVLPRWNHGGGAQSILAEASCAVSLNSGIRHEALSLEAGGALPLLRDALKMRLRVHRKLCAQDEAELLEAARVVVLHYWNAPSVRAFLDRWRGRSLRFVLYSRVNGLHRPQRLPLALANSACHVVLTSPHLRKEIEHARVSVVPAIVRISSNCDDEGSDQRLSVLHVGTLNVFKLSPHFVPLHAHLANEGCPIEVVGVGGDEDRFRLDSIACGAKDQFRWRGFENGLATLYTNAKVLSYPISSLSYASSDKVVQESQLCGLPVLGLEGSPISHLISPGETGLLAKDFSDYRRILEGVVSGSVGLPSRSRVKEFASRQHDPERKCEAMDSIYREVAEMPKRSIDDGFREFEDWIRFQVGATESLGDYRRPSLEELRANLSSLERHQRYACEGGLAHYVNEGYRLE